MVDPTNVFAMDDVKFMTGLNVEPVVVAEASIQQAISKYYGTSKEIELAAMGGEEDRKKFVHQVLKAWNDTEAFAFLPDADGSVWIGTAAGMTHIRDPERLLHPQGPLDLRIASARLGERVLDIEHETAVPWRAANAKLFCSRRRKIGVSPPAARSASVNRLLKFRPKPVFPH